MGARVGRFAFQNFHPWSWISGQPRWKIITDENAMKVSPPGGRGFDVFFPDYFETDGCLHTKNMYLFLFFHSIQRISRTPGWSAWPISFDRRSGFHPSDDSVAGFVYDQSSDSISPLREVCVFARPKRRGMAVTILCIARRVLRHIAGHRFN